MGHAVATDAGRSLMIHHLSLKALSQEIASARLSAVAVTEAFLARIAAHNNALGVFVHLDAEGALAQARACDAEISAGKYRGALHGIPLGIKDIIDVAGMPTTCGSRVMGRKIARSDAAIIKKARDQGAVILGKVATHEFANGLPSLDLLDPPARNPWNREYHPGGSSSGSGAGVAAGFFPLSIGSDTGGSARHPATHCGIAGLKPTYGVISCKGIFPLSFSLDTVGLLASTAEDLAIALSALAEVDPGDPTNVKAPWQTIEMSDLPLADLRIGFVRHFHQKDLGAEPADPDVVAALERAAALFAASGATVEDCQLAPLSEYFAVNRIILSSDAWVIHKDQLCENPELYGRSQREALATGAFIDAETLVRAQMRRAELVAQMAETFSRYDLLLCASSMETSQRFDEPGKVAKAYARQARAPFNVTGNPAISMMAGLAANGLPLAIQLAAAPFHEPLLLRAAQAYEKLRGPMPRPEL